MNLIIEILCCLTFLIVVFVSIIHTVPKKGEENEI